MSDRKTANEVEHRWAIEAMPWRLNHTMKDKDMARLNTHLLECEDCRNRFAAEQILAENMRRGSDSLAPEMPSAQASLARLKAQRDAQSDSRIGESEFEAARRRKSAPARWMLGAIAAQAVAIALLATWMLRPPASGPVYETMSSTQTLSIPHLKVEFAQEATVEQVRSALGAINGRVAAGPSIAGVFVVVDDSAAGTNHSRLEEQAKTLMTMPGVRFVAVYRGEQGQP